MQTLTTAFTTLGRYLRIYLMLESQYIKARLQYRADFWISSIGMAFTNVAGIFGFWVLFGSINSLVGWTFHELIFIYAFYWLAISPLQVLFDNIWNLRMDVQEGTFLKYYFRPLNMLFYYLSERFDLKGLTEVAAGIIGLIYASSHLGLVWTLSKLLLLAIMLGGSALVIIAIMLIASSTAFWITNSYPVMALAFRLREFSPYPMTIYDGVFRLMFTYLIPLGFIAFYPSQLFLRPAETSPIVYLSPLVGIISFAVAYWVWVRGVNQYTGTGS